MLHWGPGSTMATRAQRMLHWGRWRCGMIGLLFAHRLAHDHQGWGGLWGGLCMYLGMLGYLIRRRRLPLACFVRRGLCMYLGPVVRRRLLLFIPLASLLAFLKRLHGLFAVGLLCQLIAALFIVTEFVSGTAVQVPGNVFPATCFRHVGKQLGSFEGGPRALCI